MDIVNHNSSAWDKKVEEQVIYTKAVSTEIIEKVNQAIGRLP